MEGKGIVSVWDCDFEVKYKLLFHDSSSAHDRSTSFILLAVNLLFN